MVYNQSMKLTGDDVKHVAKLASLPLTDEETSKLESELSETLNYVQELNEIDTKGVMPTSQVTGLENVEREDVAADSLTQDQALSNAKSKKDGFFVVKVILEQ